MSQPAAGSPRPLAGRTVVALLLASAQAPLGSTMIAVGLPSISHDLSQDLALCTSLLVTSYLIVNIIAQSPGGKLGDVFGHPEAVRSGIILQTLGAASGIVAPGLYSLVAARCTLALGGALVLPATMAVLRSHVAPERRGRMFGLVGATMGLSAAIGPFLGGELVTRFGWRSMFAAPLPLLGAAALLLRAAPLPISAAKKTSLRDFARTFDFSGTALFALGLCTLVLGSKSEGTTRATELAASLLVLGAFFAWETRAKSPVLDPRLFTHRAFVAGSMIIALQNFAMYGLLFLLPQFFQRLRGATPREVGLVLLFMMLAMFVGAPLGGRLSDRIGARGAALAGAVSVVGGLALLGRLEGFAAPIDAAPALGVLGVGLGLSNAPAQAAAMAAVAVEQSGMAAGATSTLRYLGGVVSVLVLSMLVGHGTAVSSYLAVVHVAGVAAAVAVMLAFALPGRLPGSRVRS